MSVPSDALFLITSQPASGELRQLAGSDFLKSQEPDSWGSEVSAALLRFDSLANTHEKWRQVLDQSPLFISGHHSGSGRIGVLYFFTIKQTLAPGMERLCESLVGARDAVRIRRFGQAEIHDWECRDGRSFSWTISRGVFIGTYSPYLIEDALRQQAQEEASALVRAIPDFIQEGSSINLAIRYSVLSAFLQTQFNRETLWLLKPLARFGEWSILSLDLSKKTLAFQGQTLPADSFSFVSLFAAQRPVQWTLFDRMPRTTISFIAWGMDDPADFIQQLSQTGVAGSPEDTRLRQHFKPWIGQECAFLTYRQLTDSVRDQPIALIKLRNEQACRSYLRLLEGKPGSREESYQGLTIRLIPRPGILKAVFGSVYEPVNRFYYTIMDGYLVVSNQASALRGYINAINDSQRMSTDAVYRQVILRIPEKGNVLFYANLSLLDGKPGHFLSSQARPWVSQVMASHKGAGAFLLSLQQSNGIFLTEGLLEHPGPGEDPFDVQWMAQPEEVVDSVTAPEQNTEG